MSDSFFILVKFYVVQYNIVTQHVAAGVRVRLCTAKSSSYHRFTNMVAYIVIFYIEILIRYKVDELCLWGENDAKINFFLKVTYLGIYTLKKNFSVESTHIFIFKNYTNCKRKNKRLFFFFFFLIYLKVFYFNCVEIYNNRQQ